MRTQSYPSDVTDGQWVLIEPHLPVYPGGRPRKTNLRDVVDAVLYVLRTGCQWRYLPKDFPPKSTVWRYFDDWRHNGTLDTIHDRLRTKVRTQEKPYAPRTTASVDSQSVDTTSGGEQRGRDNAKNVDGRKRHIVVLVFRTYSRRRFDQMNTGHLSRSGYGDDYHAITHPLVRRPVSWTNLSPPWLSW